MEKEFADLLDLLNWKLYQSKNLWSLNVNLFMDRPVMVS